MRDTDELQRYGIRIGVSRRTESFDSRCDRFLLLRLGRSGDQIEREV
jgi:hypothetical protein